MRYLYILYTLVFSTITTILQAQNPLGSPLVTNYNKVLYGGGSRTWDIKQDSRGIMYFGNNEGLLSFNGKYWKQYKLPNQTIVRSIHIDTVEDKIYVGGQGEFGYFEKSSQSGLRYVSLMDLIPMSSRQFADVWHTVAFEEGIYFMSANMIYAFKGGRIITFPSSSEWFYMGVSGGKLYAQDYTKGLLQFVSNQWKPIASQQQFAKNKISGMVTLAKDSVLVKFQNNRSFLLSSTKFVELNAAQWYDMYTPSLAAIDKDKYVMATSTKGCQIRKNSGELLEQISINEGLQNNNVTAVFVDKQQNIWAAIDNTIVNINYGGGIRYIRPNILNEVMGYSTRVYQNSLYLSSSNGVYVAKLDPSYSDQSLSPGRFNLIKGSDGGEAWRLDEVNGHLLMGHNRGIYTVQGEQVQAIATDVGSWYILPLSSVYPIEYSIVGTYYGLNLLAYDGKQYKIQHRLNGVFDSFRFLAQDVDGTLYSSHPYRGIYRFDINKELTSYKTNLLTAKDGLPSSNQNYVFKIKNRIVFATENGVYEYDKQKGRFIESAYFSAFKGIPIKFMIDDKEGNIWFSSGKKIGVARYNKENNKYSILYISEIEGMNTLGFENIYPFDLDNIYIGSEKGAIHINFPKYIASKTKPTILLSSVRTVGDSLLFDGFSPMKPVPFHSSFTALHFEFTSPNYGIHENAMYSYWLVGNDKSWSSWSKNTTKDYTNLSSGEYTFKVKSKNNLNEESEVLTYTFTIKPPWYKSSWAYLVYGVLLILIAYAVVIIQKKAWIKQQIKFDEKMQQIRYIHQLEVEKNEKEIVKLQNEKLVNEVESKTKELASTSMQLMENSGAITKLRIELSKIEDSTDDSDLMRITSLLKEVENNTTHWDQFAAHFDELNNGFLSRLKLKHPNLSRNDLKVCAYLRLHFTTKQIAQLQNISVRGTEIHRYRLRKKLGLSTAVSITNYLESI